MFITTLDLRAYKPDEWVVLAPLEWESKDARLVVPRGFITDLASVPRALRGVLDINGASRAPAVLHDFAYCSHWSGSREKADALFRDALEACGVGAIARYMYWRGVRLGGRQYWNERERGLRADYDFVPDDYWSKRP